VQISIETGQNEEAAGRKFLTDIVHQSNPIATWHGDIAEKEVWMEVPGLFKGLLGGVAGERVKATLLEDQTEGIGDQTVVIYDQNSLRSRYHRCGLDYV
jgi:hypothetical protein